ncbi:MAG: tetratricopeptide repeat-containing glycosyltransferase family protein [Oryzomonas sp.]|uniref:tetratricopeptide repeat-containing glycosyltransferase family protein n=1 Tax=Oryzomonas sp. TaxID=2855186 RepID=UPI0028470D06|nr:tetratricopeptide repeat-containing glycosyltransferase family protein [Oryzomonas sp.]MDR3581228.1 tetratricopeptide repeat-containing glycosyltransferase family protein [Oryzomonas sp.]
MRSAGDSLSAPVHFLIAKRNETACRRFCRTYQARGELLQTATQLNPVTIFPIETVLNRYRRIFSICPDNAEAHYNLGVLLHILERFAEAEACYLQALSLHPIYAEAHNNLGNLYQQLERFAEAEACYQRALYIRQEYAEVNYNLGVLLQRQERLAEAETCYRHALSIRPGYAEAHNNLGNLLQELKFFAEAEASYQHALALRPVYAEAHYNLGNLFQELKRFTEAEACYQRTLSLRPDYAKAHNNLGIMLQALKRFSEAEACYKRALSLCSDHAEVHNNLGVLLKDLKRFAEAEVCFQRALLIRPDYVDAKWNLSLLLLFLGKFKEGWPLFESRYDLNLEQSSYTTPPVHCRHWSGEDLEGKSIIIWPEQGFGDEIQFIRYLPLLKALGTTQITLVCKGALKPLFLNSAAGYAQVLAKTEAGQLAHHDFWTRPLSLPLYFKTTLETIPAELPYLAPDANRARLWMEKLPRKGFKVGLAWKGDAGHKNDANRSLSGLASLAPLWSATGVTFISLQKGRGEKEASTPIPGQPILHLGSDIVDFSDTAAIVSQLDLVICVDTAIAHLAGALGKSCWVLLPFVGTDWRWLDNREDSPWYPRVIRLFRQTEINNWDEVVERVRSALISSVTGSAKM